MAFTIAEVLDLIDTLAPWQGAEPDDNVGLLLGSPTRVINKILFTPEVSSSVLKEAVKKRIDLLIVYQPLIFQPLSRINYETYPGCLIRELIRKDIALISVHTNLDKSPWGANFALAESLGLKKITFLFPDSPVLGSYKFVVFVPEGYEGKIIDAIARGGGGVIGNYSHCSFRTSGRGTFVPLSGAKPFIGEQGKLEEVAEYRLEAIVPRTLISKVLAEVLKVHPYEEPAYDIYPLAEIKTNAGIGCVGELRNSKTLRHLALRVKKILTAKNLQMIGNRNARVRKIAICCGSAERVIGRLSSVTADAIIVGEINHYTTLAAKTHNINIIAAGHYETEVLGITRLGKAFIALPQVKKAKLKIEFALKSNRTQICAE